MNLVVQEGIPRKNTLNVENGDVVTFTGDKWSLQAKYRTVLFWLTKQVPLSAT